MSRKQGAPIRLTSAVSPCKGCPERMLGCHSNCEAYASFRAECDALLEARRSKQEYNDYIDDTLKRFPGLRSI